MPKLDTFAHRVTPPRAAAAVDFRCGGGIPPPLQLLQARVGYTYIATVAAKIFQQRGRVTPLRCCCSACFFGEGGIPPPRQMQKNCCCCSSRGGYTPPAGIPGYAWLLKLIMTWCQRCLRIFAEVPLLHQRQKSTWSISSHECAPGDSAPNLKIMVWNMCSPTRGASLPPKNTSCGETTRRLWESFGTFGTGHCFLFLCPYAVLLI